MTPDRGISVDPGVTKGHGIAIWAHGELQAAYLLPSAESISASGTLAIEIPVVRQAGQQSGRQRDIINLAVAAGGFIGRHSHLFEHVFELAPEDWGGQIPAKIKYERILSRLTTVEQERIEWPKIKALRDDVLAAIGIGFHVFSPARSLLRKGT